MILSGVRTDLLFLFWLPLISAARDARVVCKGGSLAVRARGERQLLQGELRTAAAYFRFCMMAKA